MNHDFSFVISDGSTPENPRAEPYLNKIFLAKWFNTDPSKIDELDPITQILSLSCMSAEGIANERRQAIQNAKNAMKGW